MKLVHHLFMHNLEWVIHYLSRILDPKRVECTKLNVSTGKGVPCPG